MYCPHCGKPCPDTSKFCPSCGSAIQPGGSQQNTYQQNTYQQNTCRQSGRAPIASRSIAMCIVLTLVTCGIYGLYWFVCLVNDLNTASDRPGDSSGGMVLLLTLVTCGIYNLFWIYKAGQKVTYMKQKYSGVQDSDPGVIYLLLDIFGLGVVAWALIQSELNQIASC